MSASPFPIAFQLEPEGEDERRRRYDPTEPEYWMQLPPETEPVEAIHFLLHIVGSEVPRQQYDTWVRTALPIASVQGRPTFGNLLLRMKDVYGVSEKSSLFKNTHVVVCVPLELNPSLTDTEHFVIAASPLYNNHTRPTTGCSAIGRVPTLLPLIVKLVREEEDESPTILQQPTGWFEKLPERVATTLVSAGRGCSKVRTEAMAAKIDAGLAGRAEAEDRANVAG